MNYNNCEFHEICGNEEICKYIGNCDVTKKLMCKYTKKLRTNREDIFNEIIETLAQSEETILTEKQYFALMRIREVRDNFI